jgi:hypothetical protein
MTMSTLRKSILSAALMLTLVLGSTAPASGQDQGIWVYLPPANSILGPFFTFSVSLINLTEHRLLITENSLNVYCEPMNLVHSCGSYQSNPFEGHGTLNLDPHRTAIWKSHKANTPTEGEKNGWGWNGTLTVQPEGMDDWAVTLNARAVGPNNGNLGWGTWVYLETDFSANPDWSQAWNTFSPYGIWVTPNFLNYTNQNPPSTMENVMTLSGRELAVSLYTATTDNDHVTLVFRQNFYPDASSDTLDQSQSALPWIYRPSFGAGVYLNGYNETRMAQTFTAGQSGILDRVSVYIDDSYTPNGPVTVSIQTVTNGLPSGIEIGHGMIPARAIPFGPNYAPNPQWVSTAISANAGNSLAMTPGTQYAIVLSAGGGDQITWFGSGNVYSGGHMVFDYASGWGSVPNADAMFQTYIIPPTAKGDDYVGWPLSFVDNAGNSVP